MHSICIKCASNLLPCVCHVSCVIVAEEYRDACYLCPSRAAFPALSCLDVRGTHISRHFLQPLQSETFCCSQCLLLSTENRLDTQYCNVQQLSCLQCRKVWYTVPHLACFALSSLSLLAAKGKLSSSPNEPQVLAHSNKVLIDLQKGIQCGCQLLGIFPAASATSDAPATGISTIGTSPGAVAQRQVAPAGGNSDGNSARNSNSARLSIPRAAQSRSAPMGGEEKQWQELCVRGALAYLEAAGAEEAAGRQPL